MALPASGQISFNDVRVEMAQSTMTDYKFGSWAFGSAFYVAPTSYPYYAPINVHSSNAGKYTTTCTNIQMSSWYAYNHTLSYASDGTDRDLFFSSGGGSACSCYDSSMIVFDLGTSNKNYTISITGNSTDFNGVQFISVWYGKPWSGNGNGGTGGATKVYENDRTTFGTSLTISFNYNYVYDSSKGQYLYVVIHKSCT